MWPSSESKRLVTIHGSDITKLCTKYDGYYSIVTRELNMSDK